MYAIIPSSIDAHLYDCQENIISMHFQAGPRKFQKLPLGSKVLNFQVHHSEPILLALTSERKLDEFYLRDLDKNGIITHPLPMKSLHVNCIPEQFSFSQKNIVHCDDSILRINNKHELLHKANINHLLVDDSNIALTTCQDSIFISSIAKAEALAQLHYYGDNITSLFWNNSLAISGDQRGMVNLWDINKQSIINSNMIHASGVDFIGSYVDYIHTNLYYTLSKKQGRATFHDMRTYKPIKITNNLPKDIIDINHNPTGKIFITTQKQVQFIDVYQGFYPIGKFAAIPSENIQVFRQNSSGCEYEARSITKMVIWDQYAIAGCSNGCIEVYDSDLLKCLYSFGVCQFSGVKNMKRMSNSLIVLEEKGLMSVATLV